MQFKRKSMSLTSSLFRTSLNSRLIRDTAIFAILPPLPFACHRPNNKLLLPSAPALRRRSFEIFLFFYYGWRGQILTTSGMKSHKQKLGGFVFLCCGNCFFYSRHTLYNDSPPASDFDRITRSFSVLYSANKKRSVFDFLHHRNRTKRLCERSWNFDFFLFGERCSYFLLLIFMHAHMYAFCVHTI